MDDLTMSWARVDDSLHDHPKVIELLDKGDEGLAALGLWTLALAWAKRQADAAHPERAGLISSGMVRRLAGPASTRFARMLVEAKAGRQHGLWEEAPGGWRIHDFAYWHELDKWASRSDQAKQAAAARWQRSRAAAFAGPAGSTADADAAGTADAYADAMPPTPHQTTEEAIASSSPKPGTALAQPRPEVEALCTILADRIERNGSKRPTVTKAWRDACRLLLDKDLTGRDDPRYATAEGRVEMVRTCIEWCQRDEFWRTNILSMPKLRQQFDRLRLAAGRRGGGSRSTVTERAQRGLDLAAQMRQAQEAGQ